MPTFPATFLAVKDRADATLLVGTGSGDTTLTVGVGTGARFPASDFVVVIETEKIHVATRTVDVFSGMTRAFDGTTAATHATGVSLALFWSSTYYDRMVSNITGHTHAPADVTGTAVITTDSRLSDARTPTAHSHAPADITGTAVVTADSRLSDARTPTAHTHVAGDITGTAVVTADSRLSDARTPTAHAASHVAGGSDAVKLDDLAAPDDNTDLNASTTKHGLLAKLPGGTATFLRADGVFATPAGGSDPFATLAIALASDVSTGANQTPVDVTGLVFTFVANAKYIIEVFGVGRSAAATTGWGIQIDVSVAVTRVSMRFVHQLANTGTVTGGQSNADDVSGGVSSGIPTANSDLGFHASGILITAGTGGTAQLRWRSEAAAVSTVMAGTMMRVHRVS